MRLETIRENTEALFDRTGQRYEAVQTTDGPFEKTQWEKAGSPFRCRLVEKTAAGQLDLGAQVTWETKLLYPYGVTLPMGSRLLVDGAWYRLSGRQKTYLSHREADLSSVQQFS